MTSHPWIVRMLPRGAPTTPDAAGMAKLIDALCYKFGVSFEYNIVDIYYEIKCADLNISMSPAYDFVTEWITSGGQVAGNSSPSPENQT